MKNLPPLFLIVLVLVSCKKKHHDRVEPILKTEPQTPVVFDISKVKLTGLQAPFLYDASEVRLKEAFLDGKLLTRYIYKDGHLSEFKRYVTYNDVKPWFTISFKRTNGILKSYEVKTASFTPEGRTVADLPEQGLVLELERVSKDTLLEYLPIKGTGEGQLKLSFDSNGYVTRQEGYSFYPQNRYKSTYTRDADKNITEVIHDFSSGTPSKVTFRYDTHPNPLFSTGIDWYNDAISSYSLSPNNVIELKRAGVDDYKGYSYRTTYDYKYLPNGYPSSVKVQRYLAKPGEKEEVSSGYTFSFTYY